MQIVFSPIVRVAKILTFPVLVKRLNQKLPLRLMTNSKLGDPGKIKRKLNTDTQRHRAHIPIPKGRNGGIETNGTKTSSKVSRANIKSYSFMSSTHGEL